MLTSGYENKVGTHDTLRSCLIWHAKERGNVTKDGEHCVGNDSIQFLNLVNSMNTVDWRRFMECMLSEKVLRIQGEYALGDSDRGVFPVVG